MLFFRILLCTFFPLFSWIYPSLPRSGNSSSICRVNTRTEEGIEAEPEDIASPRSLGVQLVRFCRSGKLQGAVGIMAVKDFLSRSCDLEICDRQGTALMWASFFGFPDIVNLLLSHRASVHQTSDLGYTPLHAASQRGHKPIVEVLIGKGALFDTRGHCGSTPLHLAAREGKTDLVEYLIRLGANVETQDIQGRTPLHLAAWKGHDEVVRVLLKAKVCVDVKALGGFTPVHAAAFAHSPEVIELLIGAKANVFALTDTGETIITLAVKGGNNGINGMVDYLEGLLNRIAPKKNDQKLPDIITL